MLHKYHINHDILCKVRPALCTLILVISPSQHLGQVFHHSDIPRALCSKIFSSTSSTHLTDIALPEVHTTVSRHRLKMSIVGRWLGVVKVKYYIPVLLLVHVFGSALAGLNRHPRPGGFVVLPTPIVNTAHCKRSLCIRLATVLIICVLILCLL